MIKAMTTNNPHAASPATRLQRGRLALQHLASGTLDALCPQTDLLAGAWIPGDAPPLQPTNQRALDTLLASTYCRHCARSARPETLHDGRCALCRGETFWNLRAVVRLGPYEAPLRDLLLQLKYHDDERALALLTDALADRLAAQPWWPAVTSLTPVPMHWIRRWQRPGDHAATLARALSRRLRVPVRRLVRRTAYRPSQVQAASHAQRLANVRGSFAVRTTRGLSGECPCLVDNILTSGATLHEIARVLHLAGVPAIYAAVGARATLGPRPQPSVVSD
jgi:predicted amidophosphoribosyltransferase